MSIATPAFFLLVSCCGEGGALQTNVTGLCGEHSQCSGHTGFAPTPSVCAFPVTLLRVQAALLGAGPELRALPRPKPLRFRFSGTPQRCRLRWACVLCLPGLSSSGRQELDECTCSRCRVPYPLRGPSLSFQLVQCSSCLSWGADLCLRPSRQMSTIQNLRKCLVRNWKPVCSLVGDSVSGAELPLSGSGWSLVLLSSCKWPAVP